MMLEIFQSVLLGSLYIACALYGKRPWEQKRYPSLGWQAWVEAIVTTAMLIAGLIWIWST